MAVVAGTACGLVLGVVGRYGGALLKGKRGRRGNEDGSGESGRAG